MSGEATVTNILDAAMARTQTAEMVFWYAMAVSVVVCTAGLVWSLYKAAGEL